MGLLERDALLDCLAENYATSHDRGRALFLGGEAGAGKTALVRAFAERIAPAARLAVANCDPLDTPRPLAGIADLAWAVGGDLAAAVDAAAPVHHVARTLLEALERVGPVVIEDLQWADAATLDVVRIACRRVDQITGGLLVLTYRDDGIGRGDPLRVLLGEVGTMRSVTRVHVDLLSVDAVAALAAGTGVNPAALHRRTEGNPFFVTEILGAGGESMPATVSDAVLARAARLSPEARELLDAVAVVPQTCEWSLLDALLPGSAERAEECCAGGLLVETDAAGGGVQFRHELTRQALESALPAIVRRRAHAAVLAHLVAAGGSDPARLAHHAEGAGDDGAIFEHCAAAGMAAAAKGAHTEALKHLRAALAHATDLAAGDEARLAGTLAIEAYLSDLSAEAVTAQRRAVAALARAGDRRAEGEAWARLSRMQWLDADLAGAFASADRALALLEPCGTGRELAMACSQRSALAMLTMDNAGAVSWGERAIALAETCEAVDVQSHALNNIGTSEWCFGRERGRDLLLRSLELALQVDSEEDVGRAYANLSEEASRRMDSAGARRYIEDGLTYSRSRGLTRSRVCLEARTADLATIEARYDDAGSTLDFLLALPSISRVTRLDALIGLGLVRARRGDPGVWDVIDEVLVAAQEFGQVDRVAGARRAEIEAAFLEGDVARAEAAARVAIGPAMAVEDQGADELVWWARRLGIDVAQPDFAREPFMQAAAGDHVGAAGRFTALGWRYHAALSLHDAGDTDSLRGALEVAHEISARPLARIVTRRLQAHGARAIARGPRPSTRTNEAGLTAREAEVLELLTGQRTNREIAAELVVSVRTVEHHVAAVLAKLDASSRGDAVARAGELGLLQSG